MSFQGGDGYQYFMNHDLSFAAVTRILNFVLMKVIKVIQTLCIIHQTLELSSSIQLKILILILWMTQTMQHF